MQSVYFPSTPEAPPIFLQSDRVRRRIAASDSVAALIATLAFGAPRRSDLSMLSAVTADRITTSARAL